MHYAKITKMTVTAIIAAATVAYGLPKAYAQKEETTPSLSQDSNKEQETFAIAKDAYIYAYPLVTMEMTRRVMTNAAKSRPRMPTRFIRRHGSMSVRSLGFFRCRKKPGAITYSRCCPHGPMSSQARARALLAPALKPISLRAPIGREPCPRVCIKFPRRPASLGSLGALIVQGRLKITKPFGLYRINTASFR
jgi:hypothetical protein